MKAYLDGIKAKLERADENINNLNLELTRFLRDNYRIGHQFNIQARKYIFTAHGESEVPPRFSVLIGEIVHNLRSILDHVVTQLAAIGPGGGNPYVLEFPICRTPEKFKQSCQSGKIKGVTGSAATLIEELQPYRTSDPVDTSSLLILHDLNRSDKHRLLVVVVAVVQMANTLVFTKSKTAMDVIDMSPPIPPGLRPHKDGAEVFVVSFGKNFDPEMEMNSNFSFQVAFDQNATLKNRPVIEILVALRDAVVMSVLKFFPELGPP